VRDYFDMGVIAYGGAGVYNGFGGALGTSILHPLSQIEQSPLRVEERRKKVDDGAGGIVEQPIKFPVWFDATANGGTPMRGAVTKAAEELVAWCDLHPNSFPPTVLHITDGASTDGDPEELAMHLREIQTNDGQVLMFNLHVTSVSAALTQFPSTDDALPDDYARLLFRMSSPLPERFIQYAVEQRSLQLVPGARGFMFNAQAPDIVQFFDIGTRASQLR
jgi:hypothetical protein